MQARNLTGVSKHPCIHENILVRLCSDTVTFLFGCEDDCFPKLAYCKHIHIIDATRSLTHSTYFTTTKSAISQTLAFAELVISSPPCGTQPLTHLNEFPESHILGVQSLPLLNRHNTNITRKLSGVDVG